MSGMLEDKRAAEITNKVICIVLGVGMVFVIIYGIVSYLDYRHAEEKRVILQNPGQTTGTIIGLRGYKGKDVTVEYEVNGKTFQISTSVTREFYNSVSFGDTVPLIYSKREPQIAVLKYEFSR